jgi:HK97 gp10 family phage protein
MATNVSVQRFRALTQDLKQEVHDGAVRQLGIEGDRLVSLIEEVAPRGATGELEHSIRKIAGKSETQIRVVAGSAATIRAGYSYPRADEFGTVKQVAKPFFFPSYRLLKKSMINGMKTKIRAAIKKRSAQ